MTANKKVPAGARTPEESASTVAASHRFKSSALGAEITPRTVGDIHPDDLHDVRIEVAKALELANGSRNGANREARTTGGLPPEALLWATIESRRRFLLALHQRLKDEIKRHQRLTRDESNNAWLQEQAKAIHGGPASLEYHFCQVVRLEAAPVDYQRWVLQAEARRRAAISRQQQQQQQQVAHG